MTAVRGKPVHRVMLSINRDYSYVEVEAYGFDGERLFHRFLFRPFWHDFWRSLTNAIDRERQ